MPAALQVDTNRAHHAVAHASGSCGRVLSLEFSPFLKDLLLTVGASGFVLWRLEGGDIGQVGRVQQSNAVEAALKGPGGHVLVLSNLSRHYELPALENH